MSLPHTVVAAVQDLDAQAAVAQAHDGGALWTVVGLGAVILVAYVITRVATSPLARRPGGEAVEPAASPAPVPVGRPSAPAPGTAAPGPTTAAAPPGAGTRSAAQAAALGAGVVPVLQAGVIEVDPLRRVVLVDGERLDLTDTEYRLLVHLVDHGGQVLTRADLLRDVWGHKEAVYSRTVDTHIQRLRDKLGAARDQLETIRGAGYRLRDA